ncbi:hypothetical protein Bbad01_08160 [Bacillus badius]|nr:hypothetical protein Bbad01_08160 [Bacillus badius]
MKFTLRLNNEEKTFHPPVFVPGLVYRKILEMQAGGRFPTSDPTDMDEMVQLLCEAYGNQFTVDDFWNGINAPDINETIWGFVGFVNGTNKKDSKDNKKEGK